MTQPMPAREHAIRAVLFATPKASYDVPVPGDFPAALLPLGHASVVERLIEQLARCAVTDIDLVACDGPELLRRTLGDGERWGVRLRWHLVKDPARPYGVLRSIGPVAARRVLIGHADRWPAPEVLRRLACEDRLAVQLDESDDLVWSGWASFPGAWLQSVGPHFDERALGSALARHDLQRMVLGPGQRAGVLDARRLLDAQRSVIRGSPDAPIPAAWIPMPWGSVSPLARVHPGAEVQGPVLIGPGCLVEDGAHLGPNTVLSSDVVVCGRTSVRDSLLLPGTYLGRGLDVSDAIVNGERVRHVRLGVETILPRSEGLMLSLRPRGKVGPSLVGRAIAALAAAALSPMLAAHVLARRSGDPPWPWVLQPVVVGLNEATRRPSELQLRCERPASSTFQRLASRYGGLLDVALGRRCWFGVRPRRSAEWYALSAEWQSLLARAPVGFLHAPAWSAEDGTRMEASAAADVFYAVRRNWRENLRLVFSALRVDAPSWSRHGSR